MKQNANMSFLEAFAPLAYHLFPDGRPSSALITPSSSEESSSSDYLSLSEHDYYCNWPLHASPVVSYEDANLCMTLTLTDYVRSMKGLLACELHMMLLAACATLPPRCVPHRFYHPVSSSLENDIKIGQLTDGGSKYVVSKLKDGNSTSFKFIMRHLMIPAAQNHFRDSTSTENNEGSTRQSVTIFSQTIELLLQIASNMENDEGGKAAICKFLTLLTCRCRLHNEARTILSDLYTIPFQILITSSPTLYTDVARLLYFITTRQHVLTYRAAKIRSLYDSVKTSKDGPINEPMIILYLLLHLYHRYDPKSTRSYLPRIARSFSFLEVMSKVLEVPGDNWSQIIRQWYDDKANDSGIECRKGMYNNKKVYDKDDTKHLLNQLDEYQSLSFEFLPNLLKTIGESETDLTMSRLLENKSFRHALNIAAQANVKECNRYHQVIVPLRTILPFLLYDEWHYQNYGLKSTRDKTDPRSHLLKSISRFVMTVKYYPKEIEDFIFSEILPNFDYSVDMAESLFGSILPSVRFQDWVDFEKRAMRFIEKHFVFCSAKLKGVIVDSISCLLKQWFGRCVASNSPIDCIEKLISWSDSLFVTGLVAEENEDGVDNNIIRLAVISFYKGVCDLASQSHTTVLIPSPSLVYRLLLCSTSVSIELLCGLLLQYKAIFEKLKNASTKGIAVISSEHISRMTVFNCYVWDICSILWRKSALPVLSQESIGIDEDSHQKSILFTDVSSDFSLQLHSLPDCFSGTDILSITHCSIFSPFVKSFLKEFQGDEAFPDPSIIKGKVKVRYLDYLRDNGFVNLYAFLTTFISSLAIREEKRAQKQHKRERKRKYDTESMESDKG